MKYQFLLLLPLLAIGACSSGDDAPAPKTTSTEATSTEAMGTETMGTETTAPEAVSPDNPASAGMNAIDAAKDVSAEANKTIDQGQQELDQNKP